MAIFTKTSINEGFFNKSNNQTNKKHDIITKNEAKQCIKIMRNFINSDDMPQHIKAISVASITNSYSTYLKNDKDDLIAGDVEKVFSDLYKNDESGASARNSKNLPTDYNKFMNDHYKVLNIMVRKVNADIRNTLGRNIVFSVDKNMDPRYDAFILTSKKPKENND